MIFSLSVSEIGTEIAEKEPIHPPGVAFVEEELSPHSQARLHDLKQLILQIDARKTHFSCAFLLVSCFSHTLRSQALS